MQNQKKRIIILTSVIAVILLITILLIIELISLKNSKTVEVNNNEGINNTLQEENIIENTETVENEINNTVNEVVPEENEEENIEENQLVTDPEQEVDKEIIEKQETDKDKAKRIAEEDWGKDDSVYFHVENTKDDQGRYIVNVRDNETTYPIRIYYINIETETFEILQ